MAILVSSDVPAGFPSSADDHVETDLDLNALVVKHPTATFFVRVSGDSMVGAGIFSGDLLAVDRSLKAGNGKIVVAIVDGEFTVKRLAMTPSGIVLYAENPAYPPIKIKEESDFSVWGIVTYVIRQVKGCG